MGYRPLSISPIRYLQAKNRTLTKRCILLTKFNLSKKHFEMRNIFIILTAYLLLTAARCQPDCNGPNSIGYFELKDDLNELYNCLYLNNINLEELGCTISTDSAIDPHTVWSSGQNSVNSYQFTNQDRKDMVENARVYANSNLPNCAINTNFKIFFFSEQVNSTGGSSYLIYCKVNYYCCPDFG